MSWVHLTTLKLQESAQLGDLFLAQVEHPLERWIHPFTKSLPLTLFLRMAPVNYVVKHIAPLIFEPMVSKPSPLDLVMFMALDRVKKIA